MKAQAADGSLEFWAIVDQVWGKEDEDRLLEYWKIIGLESMEEGFGNYVKRLSVDAARVLSFACGKTASFMTIVPSSDDDLQMVPG